MAHRGATTLNRSGWEDADFPILCQTCLGDNPYIRMTKERYGKECKVCNRPFTVFRWCPGARMRFKKTELCQTCAKLKNICQTCLLDLEYGLPTQVRDQALAIADDIPRSEVNKDYYIQNVERELKGTDGTVAAGSLGKAQQASDLLMKLARTTPYYKRNRPHICSFWVKGECKRGEECPYRHEQPTDPDDPLSDQNIKDRYYGVNDPVAEKLMRRAAAMPKLEPPEDKNVTTLYIGNLSDRITEEDLRENFYHYGEIRTISVVPKQMCAFVTYTTREAAELAAEKAFNKVIIHGRRLAIKWGKSQAKQAPSYAEEVAPKLDPVPGLPTLPPPPDFFNLSAVASTASLQPAPPGTAPILPPVGAAFMTIAPPPPPGFPVPPPGVGGFGPAAIHYPSQDPKRMGAT